MIEIFEEADRPSDPVEELSHKTWVGEKIEIEVEEAKNGVQQATGEPEVEFESDDEIGAWSAQLELSALCGQREHLFEGRGEEEGDAINAKSSDEETVAGEEGWGLGGQV